MVLNINTDAAVIHTNRLEKLSKSALPLAIRGTLNKAAFDVKMRSMPNSASKTFIKRQPNFLKATSSVTMAQGFKVNQMKSVVGFLSTSLRGHNNFAVRELEQQEYGGEIDKRTFIPLDVARGGSSTGLVRPSNRLSAIRGIVNSNSIGGGGSRKAKFVRAAFKAGKGGFVIGNFGNKKLLRIEQVSRAGGRLNLKTKALYSFSQGRSVRVHSTGFMRGATNDSASRLYRFYQEEATRQIMKVK